MPPKFFYFDLGRVLLDFDVDRMTCQMGLVAGISAEEAKAAVFDAGLQAGYESGQITSAAFYREFCQATGTRADETALREAASDIFEVNTSMLPLLTQLADARYRMGLLSNTCDCHWEFCRRRYRFLTDLFEQAALSYEIGAVKPDVAIFELAAAIAGFAPDEIFFVDDVPGHVDGARAAGFDAVVYRSARQVADELRRRGVRFNL